MKKNILYCAMLIITLVGCEKLMQSDIGDIAEDISDFYFPEIVGDSIDSILDFIEDRTIEELIEEEWNTEEEEDAV